jgi:hypothetical protein
MRNDIVSNVSKPPFFRRMERWLVGLVVAAMAYMLEKAVLRSIRSGRVKPKHRERGPMAKSDGLDVSL